MRRHVIAALATGALSLGLATTPAAPAAASWPNGPSGPVIFVDGQWLIRTTASGGAAQLSFRYGRAGDVPVVGDWDGNGTETVGVVRDTGGPTWQWLLRNSNSAGGADITWSFGEVRRGPGGLLGSVPVVGNFDQSDYEYEIGVVLYQPNGVLLWQILRQLEPNVVPVFFNYGRITDYPVVGDWDGDGDDTAGVVRGTNQWLIDDGTFDGGDASGVFTFGSADPTVAELPVTGDWDGNGTDTPAVLRNVPADRPGGPFQQWIYRNANSSGPAAGTFTFGGAAQTIPLPFTIPPRLAIEVT